MLARLEKIAGVRSAAVDHGGELLRLSVSDDRALDEARRVLAELGYAVTIAETSDSTNRRWYGQATIRDLSHEEARVIAHRVARPFGIRHEFASTVVDSLTSAVTTALYECFAAHPLSGGAAPGSLRKLCAEAVMSAAVPLIGEDAARDLASAIEADLSDAESPP